MCPSFESTQEATESCWRMDGGQAAERAEAGKSAVCRDDQHAIHAHAHALNGACNLSRCWLTTHMHTSCNRDLTPTLFGCCLFHTPCPRLCSH